MYPFQAELKRMSTICSYFEDELPKDFRIVVKGAPETVEKLLKEVCENHLTYLILYRYHQIITKSSEIMQRMGSVYLHLPTKLYLPLKKSPDKKLNLDLPLLDLFFLILLLRKIQRSKSQLLGMLTTR